MNELTNKNHNFFHRKIFVFLVILLFGIFAFQLWYHVARTSVTIDEVPHILAGYQHLKCGDFGINPEHPPLLKMIAAAPLMTMDLQQPDLECGSQMIPKYDGWISGFTFLTANGADRIVTPARITVSLISLLLALLVFLAARKMFGDLEAVIALTLFAFEPNIIAHGALVTTDMAVSAGLFASVFALYNYLNKPSVIRFLLIGLGVGWTICSKHSGVVVFPIVFLLLTADVFLHRKTETRTLLKRRCLNHAAAFAGIILFGFFSLWAAYGFRYSALPDQNQPTVSIDEFYKQVEFYDTASTFSGKTIKFIAETHILPESYVFGLADLAATNRRPMYLFEVYLSGEWFYFPFAFFIKSGVALILLLLAGLTTFKLYSGKKREMMFLIIPSFFFFALSMTSKINIGVRHILPVYAFFIVIAAAGACAAIKKSRRESYILITILLVSLAMNLRNAPNYIAYSNDLMGGTNKTYQWLSDSNVDWGQNLKLVNEYLEKENITDCWFASFGSGELARIGQPCKLLPGGFGADFTTEPIGVVPPVIEGTILVSTGAAPPFRGKDYISITENAQPIAQIGGSVFVYRGRFEVPLAAAASHAERADFFVKHKRFENAIVDAREALKLIPDDPKIHLNLGIALAETGQTEDARAEIETAFEITRREPLMHNTRLKVEAEMERLKEIFHQ